jgi:hypothetical protein
VGWSEVASQVALTYTASVIVGLAAHHAGRLDLIRSPKCVLAHLWEDSELHTTAYKLPFKVSCCTRFITTWLSLCQEIVEDFLPGCYEPYEMPSKYQQYITKVSAKCSS